MLDNLQRFRSKNGLNMVEGLYYNWQEESTYVDGTGPKYLHLMGEGWGGTTFLWEPEKEQITVGGHVFFCPNIFVAEMFVFAECKAKGCDVAPLYRKDATKFLEHLNKLPEHFKTLNQY